jgi:hypothetical protein
VEGAHHLKVATPAIEELNGLLPLLRAAHHVPFDRSSPCEDVLHQHLANLGLASEGALEKVSTYEQLNGGGRAIELSGWAERDGLAPGCVAVLDGDGNVIGAGAAVARRSDVGDIKGLSARLIGWRAVASFPQSYPLCVVALFPNSVQWALLSNCKQSIGNSEAPFPED